MSRQLSSLVTLPFKLTFVLWIPMSVFLIYLEELRFHPSSALLLLAWAAVTFALWAWCGRLKLVKLDGEVLAISNYLQTWRVPVTEISAVVESRMTTLYPIFIHFKSPQPFGRVAVFTPRQDMDYVGRPHPFVVELRALAGLKQI